MFKCRCSQRKSRCRWVQFPLRSKDPQTGTSSSQEEVWQTQSHNCIRGHRQLQAQLHEGRSKSQLQLCRGDMELQVWVQAMSELLQDKSRKPWVSSTVSRLKPLPLNLDRRAKAKQPTSEESLISIVERRTHLGLWIRLKNWAVLKPLTGCACVCVCEKLMSEKPFSLFFKFFNENKNKTVHKTTVQQCNTKPYKAHDSLYVTYVVVCSSRPW